MRWRFLTLANAKTDQKFFFLFFRADFGAYLAKNAYLCSTKTL